MRCEGKSFRTALAVCQELSLQRKYHIAVVCNYQRQANWMCERVNKICSTFGLTGNKFYHYTPDAISFLKTVVHFYSLDIFEKLPTSLFDVVFLDYYDEGL